MPVPKGNLAAICTIEKANAIFNHLVEENRLDEVFFLNGPSTNAVQLGLVVVDELHMVLPVSRARLIF
jgi:hypothetical protein